LKTHHKSFTGEEIFLLRNLSLRGVKFFQTSGYYPDFILWRKKKDRQTVVFIDPKGIRHVEDEKVQLGVRKAHRSEIGKGCAFQHCASKAEHPPLAGQPSF